MVGIEQNARNYTHQRRDNFNPSQRVDMTESVFYATAMRTSDGRIKGSFVLSDLITRFRLTANAFNNDGMIGHN
jgi:hypothetical protein